ncbi:MAG TPA: hypothetical protein VGE72_14495 [Azospirillum sp.]
METILGSTLGGFIGLTVIIFGFGAFMTGQVLAEGWKPPSAVIGYTLLLGVGDRFLTFALFGGPLLSISGFIVHTAAIGVIAFSAYQMARARRMVTQYPWLYERSGPFTWRQRPGAHMSLE